MKKSVLRSIIDRLEMMTRSTEITMRRFELDGVEQAHVTYNPTTKIFELYDVQRNVKYHFDSLDLVAIDLFELMG